MNKADFVAMLKQQAEREECPLDAYIKTVMMGTGVATSGDAYLVPVMSYNMCNEHLTPPPENLFECAHIVMVDIEQVPEERMEAALKVCYDAGREWWSTHIATLSRAFQLCVDARLEWEPKFRAAAGK